MPCPRWLSRVNMRLTSAILAEWRLSAPHPIAEPPSRATHTVTVEAFRPFYLGWGEVRHGYAEADAMTTVRIGS